MLHDNVANWNKTELENKDTCFYFITRFNLWGLVRYATEQEFIDWSEHRLGVFQRLCVPGVKNQTIKPHAWYVLFDESYADREEELEASVDSSLFRPIFVPRQLGVGAEMFRWFSKQTLEPEFRNFEYVLGTRLDSDDTINKRYVSFLDDCLTYARSIKQPPLAMNFPYQLRCDGSKVSTYVITDSSCAMLWENRIGARTPYFASHTKLWELFDMVECGTRFPMVAIHRHEGNIGEYAWRDLIELKDGSDILRQHFGLEV